MLLKVQIAEVQTRLATKRTVVLYWIQVIVSLLLTTAFSPCDIPCLSPCQCPFMLMDFYYFSNPGEGHLSHLGLCLIGITWYM